MNDQTQMPVERSTSGQLHSTARLGMICYEHKDGADENNVLCTYTQNVKDTIPLWAVSVRPYTT